MATLSRPSIESRHFFESLSRRHHGVLVLDFDTTIACLGSADGMFPYPTVTELIDSILSMTGTRVIVATARPAEELRQYFSSPGPEIWTQRQWAATGTLGETGPVAYLAGGSGPKLAGRVRVSPRYQLGSGQDTGAPAEDLVQFLVEWLRACRNEIC